MTYDAENRLTHVGSTVLTASYSGDNLRAKKTAGGTTTYFLYDGWRVVCELNGSGSVTAYNTSGTNGLVSRRASSSSTFYTFDPEGSIAQRLDSSGNVLTSQIFDGFGVGSSTGSYTEPFGFGAQWGYYTDQETGLVLCTHRYYDPGLGRWLTRDPLGDGGGVNLYSFCENEPVTYADPDGLARRPGATPPGSWPPLPPNLGGKKPKWNPGGYWDAAGGGYVWDPTGHGGGHWDLDQRPGTKKGKGKRWDISGNPIPCQGIGWGVIAYVVISEALSLLVPPRNLVPAP